MAMAQRQGMDSGLATDLLEGAIDRASAALRRNQGADGCWSYPLEADCTIPAEYVLHSGDIAARSRTLMKSPDEDACLVGGGAGKDSRLSTLSRATEGTCELTPLCEPAVFCA